MVVPFTARAVKTCAPRWYRHRSCVGRNYVLLARCGGPGRACRPYGVHRQNQAVRRDTRVFYLPEVRDRKVVTIYIDVELPSKDNSDALLVHEDIVVYEWKSIGCPIIDRKMK